MDYLDIPVITRLEIAGKIYGILGRNNDFWCRFYRILGYHSDNEGELGKAYQARTKALNLAGALLRAPSMSGRQKEYCIILAAMHNFTGHQDSAIMYLDKASLYIFQMSNRSEEYNRSLDEHLNTLITQYKELLQQAGSYAPILRRRIKIPLHHRRYRGTFKLPESLG